MVMVPDVIAPNRRVISRKAKQITPEAAIVKLDRYAPGKIVSPFVTLTAKMTMGMVIKQTLKMTLATKTALTFNVPRRFEHKSRRKKGLAIKSQPMGIRARHVCHKQVGKVAVLPLALSLSKSGQMPGLPQKEHHPFGVSLLMPMQSIILFFSFRVRF